MIDSIKICALTMLLGFGQTIFGATCAPSQVEIDFAETMTKFAITPLWGNYPKNVTFAIHDEDEKQNSGHYVIYDQAESKKIVELGLAEACDDQPQLLKIKKSSESIVKEGYFPSCSSVPNEEACSPPLKEYYEKTQKSVGLHLVQRKRTSDLYTEFGFKYQLTDLQMAIYNSSHEMFHGYQEDRNNFNDRLTESETYYDECLNLAVWANQYEKERSWWKANLKELYASNTSLERIRNLALEFTLQVRPLTEENKLCNNALDNRELIEGSAHFVGNFALLKSQRISEKAFVDFDVQYFDLSPDKHNYGYIYATGGALSMLLERLMGPIWHQDLEKGIPQSVILRRFLLNPQ